MNKFYAFFLLLMICTSYAQDKWEPKLAADFQKKLNSEYADPKESPLMEEDLKYFKPLEFYPISEKFVVEAHFIKSVNEKFSE